MKKTEKAHRELSFVRDYNLEIGDYKEASGLIKDGLYSFSLWEDNNTYTISSEVENAKQEQYIEKRHMIVFSYRSKSLISKDGFFYGKFDCEEYDWVERIHESNYYICRKNDKYGIIDKSGDIVMDVVYPLITKLPKIVDIDIDELFWYEPPHIRKERKAELGENKKPYLLTKITTYTGEYLLELTTMNKSKLYNKIYTFGKNYLIEDKGLYGLLSRMGKEIVPPKYAKAYPIDEAMCDWFIQEQYRTGGWMEVEFYGRRVPIANNGKYYGEIPLEYDECYCVGKDLINQYFVKKNGKCGLIEYNSLSKKYYTIIPVEYISIAFDEHEPFYKIWRENSKGERMPYTFSIVQDEEGYQLYNIASNEAKIVGEHYQSLDFTYSKGHRTDYREGVYAPFFIAQKDDKYALLSQTGTPLTGFFYQSIRAMTNNVFPVCKDGKWGLLNKWGKQLIECEWDEVEGVYIGRATLIKDGEPTDMKIDNYNNNNSSGRISTYERPTYERYAGSYAQDEMGYSDDDIDTIFDGDPSAYWNID